MNKYLVTLMRVIFFYVKDLSIDIFTNALQIYICSLIKHNNDTIHINDEYFLLHIL